MTTVEPSFLPECHPNGCRGVLIATAVGLAIWTVLAVALALCL